MKNPAVMTIPEGATYIGGRLVSRLLKPARDATRPSMALLASVLFATFAWAGTDEKIEWLTEYKAGVEAARAANKPLLLYFWAEW